MEDSQPLSVESFSYTWLVNRNPSLDSPNRSFRLSFDGSSFIEMDPNLTPSKRFLVHQDFDFKVPNYQAPMTLVHADKLIVNGIVVPSKPHCPSSTDTIPVSPTTQREGRFRKSRSVSLRKCNKLPKIIIQKYLDLVRPLWCRMTRGRTEHSSKVKGVENWECSSASGSRTSGADNLRRSCDSESSIHEAVVHCKKTIGMKL
ncbi:putative membrane-associated kinase regulator 6 [Bidens hawaiensis]|uniref:putative membrane-associated kinase regulator 6 n=1 Tax=Bidens hawaiensis TaxID=980011 RepID=UPI0040494726